MGQVITGSACRQWGARGFRISLRIKGLGGRRKNQGKEPRRRTSKRNQGKRAQKKNQQENQEGGTNKEEPKKEKPPASIEGKLILAGGKLKAGRSLEVVGDAEGGGEDTVV